MKYTLIGLALSLLACICLYLASDNQRWIAKSWRFKPSCAAALTLFILSWLALVQDMQRVPASFALITVVMLVLAAMPYVGVLVRRKAEKET